MSNDETIAADQIRISIEMGPEYEITDRVASLLQELQAEISDDDVSGYSLDFMKLRAPTSSDYLIITMENLRTVSYTENDTKGKKKGSV